MTRKTTSFKLVNSIWIQLWLVNVSIYLEIHDNQIRQQKMHKCIENYYSKSCFQRFCRFVWFGIAVTWLMWQIIILTWFCIDQEFVEQCSNIWKPGIRSHTFLLIQRKFRSYIEKALHLASKDIVDPSKSWKGLSLKSFERLGIKLIREWRRTREKKENNTN